jgi:flagellar hook-basal body complex protein FliE
VDLHEVMISSAEAGVAFDLMMEIRNKLLEAYQEIQRMSI